MGQHDKKVGGSQQATRPRSPLSSMFLPKWLTLVEVNADRLLKIDEVHILEESRGAVLEVIVSRMKTIGSDVRFVALSATVPNSGDIALWLGQNCDVPEMAAHEERFGP